MIMIKKTIIFFFLLFGLIQGVFANVVSDSFGTIKTLFTDTIILDGFAILFIFVGFYALYFTLLQFFLKKLDGGHRVRVVLAAMLSFFSGSTIIFALREAQNGIAVAAGSWLFLFLLIPGTLAIAFKYILFIKNRQELGKPGKFFFGATGLLSIDFLFTNFLIWASENANVGGISLRVLDTLLELNQAIYNFLLFMFFLGLISFIIYLITRGTAGNSTDESKEKKNRNEIKGLLNNIKNEVSLAEENLKELNQNLLEMSKIRGQ